MDDNNDTPTTATTPQETVSTARSRGRPRRPTAQKSVHQLVLNLTQSSEKKTPNKKQKTTENEALINTTTSVVTTKPMTTTGNEWKLGQKVEARDVVGDWYSAKIIGFNENKSQVLVHFERWSSRYDQWFDINSELIRNKTQEISSQNQFPEFQLNEEVLARWTDNRPYPATIVEVYPSQKSVLVLFFDGYRKKVKLSQIEKMPKDFCGLRVPQLKSGFEIKADHNDYKCHFINCNKGFRKQSLLNQHLKHYHKTEDKTTADDVSEVIEKPLIERIVEKPIIEKPIEKTTIATTLEKKVESTPVVANRLKRKYVRKPLSSVPLRKSNRNQLEFQNNLLATVVVKEQPVVTPNTTLPFWDARTVAEIHEADPEELVNCVCDVKEESGLMVQCECCLCWQHANCMNFNGELDVPKDGYFCLSCRFPKNVRKSKKNAFLVNHALKSGKLPEFVFSDSCGDTLATINALLGSTLEMKEVILGLNKNVIQEKEPQIIRHLSLIEEKVKQLEKEVFAEEVNELSINDLNIKNEISLMFLDLKNAKTLTLKSEERLECVRKHLRRHLTAQSELSSKSDHFLGPFLENFCFFSQQIREKHFFDNLLIGEQIVAKIVSKLDSFVLKPLKTRNRFLSDLTLTHWSLNMNSKEDLEVDDVVVVTVVAIIRHQKKVFCELKSLLDNDLTSLSDNSFDSVVKSLNEFRNPFVLKEKKFSSLLFENKKKEPKKRKSPSPSSSSSFSSSSSSSSSSSDRKRKKKRKVDKKREKKISFVVKKSSKVSSIPGFESKTDKNPKLSEKQRKQLKKDSEIERKLKKNKEK